MRVLSVMQPWASAIASGEKTVENRTWPAAAWTIGKTIAIHAGKGADWGAPPDAWTAAGLAPYVRGARHAAWESSLLLGAVLAVAELASCHPPVDCCRLGPGWGDASFCSPWAAAGQYHWQLASVRPLPEPVPCRGALGLWRLPEDVESAVRKQLETRDA